MNLTQITRELADHWYATKAYWRDAKAAEFEQRYLEPLPGMATKTGAVMNELEVLLKKIRKDCEHPL